MRSPAQAAAHAIAQAKADVPVKAGYCDRNVANHYGLAHSGFDSAKDHYNDTPSKYKHSGTPPVGALVPFAVGQFWHMAISVGGGRCVSIDIVAKGHQDVVAISTIATQWAARPLGWMDAYYGSQGTKIVPVKAPPPKPENAPAVRLANLRKGATNNDVRTYQSYLRKFHGLSKYNPSGATGYYGDETVKMTVAAYHILGMLTGDLETPGPKLLQAIGLRGA